MSEKQLPHLENGTNRAAISVWIVNYNSSAFVAECLSSLHDPNVQRIAILDNGSLPAEREELNALRDTDPRIVVHTSDTNVGFGPGVNMLSRLEGPYRSEFIWILNPDTRVVTGDPSALASLLSESDYDVISPTITTGPLDEMKIWFAGGTYNVSDGTCSHTGFGSPFASSAPDHYPSKFMTGAAPFMKTSTWELLGGFSESLFLYWEDVDLSLRAHDLGLKLGVCSSVVVWHHEGGSGGSERGHSSVYYYYMNRNRVVVCTPRSSVVSVVFGRGGRETVRLLAQPLLVSQSNRLPKFASAVRGLMSGLLTVIPNPTTSGQPGTRV